MKKTYYNFCLIGFLLLSLNISVYANLPIKAMENTTHEMFNPDYWIEKIAEKDNEIMSLEEIQDYNRGIIKQLPRVMYHLDSFPAKLSKETLLKHVDSSFPRAKLFVQGKELTDEYKVALREQINVNAIKEINEIKYGFTVKRTNLKMFPTLDIVSDTANDVAFDQLQYTAVLAYEPVLILHKSLDEKWFYVYMYNCAGWVLASDIATCPSKETWLDVQNEVNNQFLVVTGNKIKLDVNLESPEVSELELSMGSILPLAKEAEIPAFIDGRAPFDNFIVKLFVRNRLGELDYKLALVPISKDVSLGYMKFTRKNIIKQVFKMHGDRYGWGGMLNARDCSSLVLEIYRCFGFRLPRNTAFQAKCPGKTFNLVGLSIKEKQAMLDNLKPGAALYLPGHTMIYLGKDQGRYYVISALGTFIDSLEGLQTEKKIRTRTVVINELNLKRVNGKLWIEELTVGKQFEPIRFIDLEGYSKKQIIEDYANRLIMNEKFDGKFEPLASMTHAEFVVFLTKALGLKEDRKFTMDVKDRVNIGSSYSGYLGALVKEGYIKIASVKKFSPYDLVDYKYLKSMIELILKQKGINIKSVTGRQNVGKVLTVDDSLRKNGNNGLMNRYEIVIIVDNLLKYLNQFWESSKKVIK